MSLEVCPALPLTKLLLMFTNFTKVVFQAKASATVLLVKTNTCDSGGDLILVVALLRLYEGSYLLQASLAGWGTSYSFEKLLAVLPTFLNFIPHRKACLTL